MEKVIDKIVHKANSRGQADYGWLKTSYTFSFANYYDPARIRFGTLRVLNDDYVEGGEGFGMHPHDNMEIITIILEGELEHRDSMGNVFRIKENDVQTMTAGTGIFHSEMNPVPEQAVRLLQIWVYPEKKNLTPRYDQKNFDPAGRINNWQLVVSPDDPATATIHQNAWFSRIHLNAGKSADYKLHKPENGVYLFVLEGSVEVIDSVLSRRDGMGISGLSDLHIESSAETELLLMEIPMR